MTVKEHPGNGSDHIQTILDPNQLGVGSSPELGLCLESREKKNSVEQVG